MRYIFLAPQRNRRDMTEKLLKATLNPNTHTHSATLQEVSSSLIVFSSKNVT